MKPELQGGELIEKLAREPSPNLLRDFYRKRVMSWDYPFMDLGVGTFGIFDDLVRELSPEAAFELTDTAAELVLEGVTEERCAQGGWLLALLARRSGTTKMKEGVERLWAEVLARLEAAAQFCHDAGDAREALIAHYRRGA